MLFYPSIMVSLNNAQQPYDLLMMSTLHRIAAKPFFIWFKLVIIIMAIFDLNAWPHRIFSFI